MWIAIITLGLTGLIPAGTAAMQDAQAAPIIIMPLAHRDPPDDTLSSAQPTHV